MHTCDLGGPAGLRNRAMWLLGYAVAARRRVYVNLNVTDIRHDDRGQLLRVLIWRDKGKQNRKPPVGHWGRVRKGRCRDPLCPVCAVMDWIDYLAELGVRDGPLFRPVDKGGNVGGVRPIAGGGDARLAPSGVNRIFRACVAEAGLPPDITPHSLRAGFATEGYELGADGLALRRHGGWSDDSTAFNQYVRGVDDERHSPLHVVAENRRKGR
ncbi:hypothetical protein IL38_23930 [Actinopolyspora erythraea]|uniref:Tyr recombinase domain-containing protein n=1 Tax=Actinopolyspora erythraea TaxID=414996 RepID=A0ABR4WY98_9ACTN|nr:hypothetical protein IL38_23930 [Actinopolyspora erythraea]